MSDIKVLPQIQPCTPEAYELIHQGLLAFTDATQNGMRIDVDYCKKQTKILKSKIKLNQKKFKESDTGKLWRRIYPNYNFNSNKQLSTILFDNKGLGLKSNKETKKGNTSTDNEVLEGVSKTIPEFEYYLKAKKYDKILNTYLGNFIKETVDGVMRPIGNLHTTVTFRSSISAPSFQNIPKRDAESKRICRSAIVPSPGHLWVEADFSGIEVGISCAYHKDKTMINYVKHPEKNNMHTDMAIQIFMLDSFKKEGSEKILRSGTKNGFVFPQFYGDYYLNNAVSLAIWGELPTQGQFNEKQGLKLMTGKTLGQHLIDKDIIDFDDFIDHIKEVEDDFWNRRFKGYGEWKKRNVKEYYKNGYLKTLTGFICSGLLSRNDINNYPIQGSAFHCNLFTFIRLNDEIKKRGLKSKLIGQIHDSIIIDAHPKEINLLMSLLKEIACIQLRKEWKWINVPLEIEANIFEPDKHWASGSEVQVLRAA
jgi:DNA polymerase-1